MYRPVDSIYDDPLLMLDLSKPVRAFFRAGTVSAGGVLFGTDKIIHFINVGRIYHSRYLDAVAKGPGRSPRRYSMRCAPRPPTRCCRKTASSACTPPASAPTATWRPTTRA